MAHRVPPAAALLLLASLALPAAIVAFAEGPLPGFTGGFGEPTCRACHLDSPEPPPGMLKLEGVPLRYEPGREYVIAISLAHPSLARGGFQAALRYADGPDKGRSAGTLAPADDRVQIVDGPNGVHYIQHSAKGSVPATAGAIAWRLRWTAPPGGVVALDVAANAGNDDASPLGDVVATRSERLVPASAPAADRKGSALRTISPVQRPARRPPVGMPRSTRRPSTS